MGEPVNRYKLEVYVATKRDLEILVEILSLFAKFAPEYSLEPFHESTVKVTHYHYELKRK